MPVNATIEYYKAEERYREAKTKEEKIACLEEMLRLLPSHKGAEHLRSKLKKRLSKLKSEKKSKKGSRSKSAIKKEGAAQVCIIGMTNSGKTTLLNELTGIKAEIGNYQYTTTTPQFGMMKYEDVWIQVVEIPSTFDPESMGLVYNCDLIIILLDSNKSVEKQRKEIKNILEKRKLDKKTVYVVTKIKIDLKKLKKDIWKNLGIMRIYTKSPGKKAEKKPIILKEGSTVKNIVKEVHKTFLKHFRYAKIWGKSVKFNGAQVGLDHALKDKDIIEIRA